MHRPFRSGLAALALAAASLGSGCSDSSGPRTIPWNVLAPRPASGPVADSPQNAARLVEWCWTRLDTTSYRTLFTSDFQFVFGALDPYGNAYRDTSWTRSDELISFHHLVAGGNASQPQATTSSCVLDRFWATDDPRPGKAGGWHKLIRTSVTLYVLTEAGEQTVSGYANFFLVRGDSAAVPGARDSTRWYVDRWEDDTYPYLSGTHAMPVEKATWGSTKALYR